jgi:hemerythrin
MKQWSDEYTIGIAGIDRQHRTIFTLAHDLQTALDEGRAPQEYSVLLKSLNLYVQYHFNFENRCMQQYHCPVAQQNRDAHTAFAARLAEFTQSYAAHGFNHVEACTLMTMIDEWLTEHICRIDMQLKTSMQTP